MAGGWWSLGVLRFEFGNLASHAKLGLNEMSDWSEDEIHAIVTHNQIWGDRLKSIHGSEICREYCDFKQADYNELENTPTKKQELINKLLNI
jgi:hypothetical protein